MKVYKSKIGAGLVIFIVLILGLSAYPMIQEGAWQGLLLMSLTIIFIVYLFSQISYGIHGNILKVKCGFLMNKSFEISRITKISETNNPIGAPAASFDRLEISFDSHESVVISPKLKHDFIDHLKKLNPKIAVNFKSKKKATDH